MRFGAPQQEARNAIEQLRLRQAAAESRVETLREELALVRRTLAEVREAQSAADGREDALRDELVAVQRGLAEIREAIDEIRRTAATGQADAIDEASAIDEATAIDETAAIDEASAIHKSAVELAANKPAAEARSAIEHAQSDSAACERITERCSPVGAAAPDDAVALSLRPLSTPERPSAWLAQAIRRIAERSGRLAGELIVELAPVHRRLADRPLTYELRIDELGAFVVHLNNGHATVSQAGGGDARADFSLQGPAAAFAAVFAGGRRRTLRGPRVRGNRRKAQRLLRACRSPLTLAALAEADVSVWPGLLLLAMSEAVDPAWTRGHSFVVAYAIREKPGTAVYIQVHDGAPIVVSPWIGEDSRPAATVYASECALLRMLAGLELLFDDPILLSGDSRRVLLLREWFARVQGLRT